MFGFSFLQCFYIHNCFYIIIYTFFFVFFFLNNYFVFLYQLVYALEQMHFSVMRDIDVHNWLHYLRIDVIVLISWIHFFYVICPFLVSCLVDCFLLGTKMLRWCVADKSFYFVLIDISEWSLVWFQCLNRLLVRICVVCVGGVTVEMYSITQYGSIGWFGK